MPFFSFLGHNSPLLNGCIHRQGDAKFPFNAGSPCGPATLVGLSKSSRVAHCSEKNSAFMSVPSFGFFGSPTQPSSDGGEDVATGEIHEKARADAIAREKEQAGEQANKMLSVSSSPLSALIYLKVTLLSVPCDA